MIQFREKIFFWNLALTGASVAVGAAQSSKQEEQNDELKKQLKKMAKNNPDAAPQASQMVAEQKGFSIMSNAWGFAKDMGSLAMKHKTGLIGGTLMGAAATGAGYAIDKAIQGDQKKLQARQDAAEKKLAQAQQAQFTEVPATGSAGTVATAATKKGFLGGHGGSIVGGAVMGAVPGLFYLSQRQQQVDMIKNTERAAAGLQGPKAPSVMQQKTYAFVPMGFAAKIASKGKDILKSAKEGWEVFKSHPGSSTLGGISNMLGGGGKKGVAQVGSDLSEIAAKSGNSWTKGAANFIDKHGTLALAGSIPVGLGIMSATWGTGEKVTNKALRAVDKNAFKYQDSQNQQIQ